jgi:hypothetical protein
MKKFLLTLKHAFIRIGASLKEGFKHDQKRISKYIICFTAILHLIFSNIQIQAINKLTNEICGIYMFMFVLLGFVCLFNAIRLKTPSGRKIIFSILMLLAVIGVGGLLISVYLDALMHQNNVMVTPVVMGLVFSIIIIALYLFGLVEIIIAFATYKKSQKEEEKKVAA